MFNKVYFKLFCILSWGNYNLATNFHEKSIKQWQRFRRSSLSELHHKQLIPKSYNANELPPTLNNTSVVVDVSLLVLNVRNVDEMHEHISLELELKLFWQDIRLQNVTKPGEKFTVLNLNTVHHIWHPNIYFEHAKYIGVPIILARPASLRIYPDGHVRYSARTVVSVACQMNFKYYPADTQQCKVLMKTYGFETHQLLLNWDLRQNAGARLSPEASLSSFDLELTSYHNFNVTTIPNHSRSSKYSGLYFVVVLRRDISYHLIQTYLPSLIYMVVCWLSLILPLESCNEKMGYCIMVLFALTSTFGAVRQSTPSKSYIKALDLWMIICILFVVLTLIQHALINKIRRKQSKHNSVTTTQPTLLRDISELTTIENANCVQIRLDPTPLNNNYLTERLLGACNTVAENISSQTTAYHCVAKKANGYLTFIIPTLFLLFNAVYWTVLITVKIQSI